MAVLLMFNNCDTLTVQQLADGSQLKMVSSVSYTPGAVQPVVHDGFKCIAVAVVSCINKCDVCSA